MMENSQTHELKTIQPYFGEVWSGYKNFEIRKDDRNFNPFDLVKLREFDALTGKYSGRFKIKRITYILRNASEFGLKKGFCILGLQDVVTHKLTPTHGTIKQRLEI